MNAANTAVRSFERFVGFAFLILALCAPAMAQSVAWSSLQVGPRSLHAMAYDSDRGVTVLFGGAGGVFSGETWEWNGTAWSQRVVSGPSARDGHAMAYDSARHVTVLFGGYTGGGPVGYNAETWEWNGSTWTQRMVSGPSPRALHAMVYDSDRHVTVLFGGYRDIGGEGITADTWEWDGTAWTQRNITGPSARSDHAMVYDSARGVTVLFGGYNGASVYDGETWEWNGTAWTQRVGTGPSARGDHAMAYDAARGVTVLFGGRFYAGFYTLYADTWEWNGSAWVQRTGTGPSARYLGAMVFDSARGVSVLFGGDTSAGNTGETWEWNGGSWTQRVSGGPGGRFSHALAYDAARGVTVLFGGQNGMSGNVGDTWEWNGTTWAQRATGGPSARYAHAMAYDSARGVTVMFGGNSNGASSGETWEWNGAGAGSWTRRVVSGPSARFAPAMAYDTARHVTVLFGGSFVDNTCSGETWEWNGTAWTLRATSGPPARYGHAMAFDSGRGVTVLFGGNGGSPGYPFDGDTWEWNGTSWTQRVVSGPAARSSHAMAYDSNLGVTVLFGGSTGQLSGETWMWNGTAWSLRAPGGPPARYLHMMAYDTARRETVLFGGFSGNSIFGDIWGLAGACGSADFNGDGDLGTDQDIDAFFACLAGNCCADCGSADFNADGDVGTDQDIDAFFRVLAGGSC